MAGTTFKNIIQKPHDFAFVCICSLCAVTKCFAYVCVCKLLNICTYDNILTNFSLNF